MRATTGAFGKEHRLKSFTRRRNAFGMRNASLSAFVPREHLKGQAVLTERDASTADSAFSHAKEAHSKANSEVFSSQEEKSQLHYASQTGQRHENFACS